MMRVLEAQQDIRRAYVRGGPGVIVSALVWLAAAVALPIKGVSFAFCVLFIGGMLIFPVGTLVSRYVYHREREDKANVLSRTALESTAAMIGGLFAAWLFIPFHAAYVMPLCAIAVGTHYAIFRTMYGEPLYSVLGAIITAAGLVYLFVMPDRAGVAFVVAATEFVFGAILIIKATRRGFT